MRKLIAFLPLLSLAACHIPDAPPSTKNAQAEAAKRAADSITFSGNAEIENVKRRLELTSKPGNVGFILLLNEAGQPILYASVKGKITSSTKRLTDSQQKIRVDIGSNGYGEVIGDAPADDGTWGSSDPYIYFWTVDGQYMQWSGRYLYSDQPIRTRIEPLVIAGPAQSVKPTHG